MLQHLGHTRGTLHPSPLKITPSSVFFNFSPRFGSSFLLRIFLFWLLEILLDLCELLSIRTCSFFAASFGSRPLFLEYKRYKIVIQQNIGHRFFCNVIICNFLMFPYAIISNHSHNAIYFSIKHDYYHFPLVFKSRTFGQLGRPLREEPFFTLSNVTVFWKGHLTCFMLVTFFPTLFEFLFPFLVWTYNNSEVTLLSDIKQRPVFPDVQIFA